ncbi:MAG: hypothetical protein C5B52_04850 [Bacteroidetes bacterium]|nr:MAG: hypothetical protein C5B52_04850 [Bacteroidota bacterium]
MNKPILQVCTLFAGLIISACSGHSIKKNLNSAGEKAGEAVGEVVHGVSSGVENAFRVEISLSDHLKTSGLELGKIQLSNDSSGTDNLLNVYVIFKKDFDGSVTCKVFDNNGLEMGRSTEKVQGKVGNAKFFDFHFDKRTNIDRDSKITME